MSHYTGKLIRFVEDVMSKLILAIVLVATSLTVSASNFEGNDSSPAIDVRSLQLKSKYWSTNFDNELVICMGNGNSMFFSKLSGRCLGPDTGLRGIFGLKTDYPTQKLNDYLELKYQREVVALKTRVSGDSKLEITVKLGDLKDMSVYQTKWNNKIATLLVKRDAQNNPLLSIDELTMNDLAEFVASILVALGG